MVWLVEVLRKKRGEKSEWERMGGKKEERVQKKSEKTRKKAECIDGSRGKNRLRRSYNYPPPPAFGVHVRFWCISDKMHFFAGDAKGCRAGCRWRGNGVSGVGGRVVGRRKPENRRTIPHTFIGCGGGNDAQLRVAS